MPFDNIVGLLGLLSLVPLIVLYLIKPKPKEIRIPTLMFMIREKESRLKFLIKKMVFDPLFLIQLLILILISISMAKPYYISEKIAGSENVAIVLDASASMQAEDVKPSRFYKAVEIAKDVASKSGKVSIVLAGEHPAVLLQHSDSNTATTLLDSIKPFDTPTNLVDAMELVRSIVGNESRIIVISDFVVKGDIFLEKKLANEDNIIVDFVKVGGDGKNIGIVDLSKVGNTVYVTVRNYDEKAKNVVLKVLNNNVEVLKVDRPIEPKYSHLFILENLPLGKNIIKIECKDDFFLDNQAYIYIEKSKYRVLVLCEKKESYIRQALLATNLVTIDESFLPIIPSLNNYDIVLVENASINSFPPGAFEDLIRFVVNGGNLIVASNNFELLKSLEKVLPITVENEVKEGVLTKAIVNEITRDVEFNFRTTYLKATAKNSSITLAKAENPVISVWAIQSGGKVVYYGIDENSSFYQKTSYPIFWLKIVEWLEESRIGDSYKTGEVIKFGKSVGVEYNSKKFNTDTLLFEKAGFYKINGELVAVNLLDPFESDISNSVITETQFSFERNKKEVKEDLTNILINLVIFLIIAEIAYLKWRGDI